MKFQAELRDSPEVEAWLARALAMGLLVSFEMLEERARPDSEPNNNDNTPTATGPFQRGARVKVVKRSSLYPDINFGDSGVVRKCTKRGRGWAVDVDWDDGTYSIVSAGMLD